MSNHRKLHVYFLPMMAPGHMIPMVDMVRQFARHEVKCTIIMTPLIALHFSKPIETDREKGHDITIRLISLPYEEAGLPEGCEDLSSTTTVEMTFNFFKAMDLLQRPIEELLEEERPDCFVAGAFFAWAPDSARKFGIPGILSYGVGFFPLCLYKHLVQHKPHQNVESETEEFIISGLPDTITMSRQQLSDHLKEEVETPMSDLLRKVARAEETCYGLLMNSFYELEPAYAKHYREVIGRKAWHVGPVSLCNTNIEEKAQRGQIASISEHECLSWLNSKETNSVVYICFGSMSIFSASQLLEIAIGLEKSGQKFIWVVKEKYEKIEFLPEGFDRRMEGRGLIIQGWAPQVLILDHEAVGGFVTHCGWNSLLEGVTAGVPMATWPLSAEQFFNEKFVTEVLKIGISVGARAWTRRTDNNSRIPVGRELIKTALTKLMAGEESEAMRSRASALRNMAKRAVEKGGSSDNDLISLLEEVRKSHP